MSKQDLELSFLRIGNEADDYLVETMRDCWVQAMIELNNINGSMKMDKKPFFYNSMVPSNLVSEFPDRKFVIDKVKKSAIYRLEPNDSWLGNFVESVSIVFYSGKCRELSIAFINSDDGYANSVLDLRVVRCLQNALNTNGVLMSRSEIKFTLSWGAVFVVYDIKLSAPTMLIRLK